MLTELHRKAGRICGPAQQGELHCPLIVRPSSEDVITGHIAQVMRAVNPRWYLAELLNRGLEAKRFHSQVYRKLEICPWSNQARYPRELLPFDEGSTQVDLVIAWENPPTTIFVEAKYQSEVATRSANSGGHRKYPSDQLIRNIRVGLKRCGYFERDDLFEGQSRDFVALLLTPDGKHDLVKRYRSCDCLRRSIPRSDLIRQFPRWPFVGQITYRRIVQAFLTNLRYMDPSERVLVSTLKDYLNLKLAKRQLPFPGVKQRNLEINGKP